MKSNKGFSLVELIVVIAIMAIIAGVAIPVYTTYIDKADKAVVDQLLADAEYAAELAKVEYDVTVTVAKNTAENGIEIKLATTQEQEKAGALDALKQVAAVVGATPELAQNQTEATVTTVFTKLA